MHLFFLLACGASHTFYSNFTSVTDIPSFGLGNSFLALIGIMAGKQVMIRLGVALLCTLEVYDDVYYLSVLRQNT